MHKNVTVLDVRRRGKFVDDLSKSNTLRYAVVELFQTRRLRVTNSTPSTKQ